MLEPLAKRAKLSQVVQDMRRPRLYGASKAGIDRCLCCGHSWCPVHSRFDVNYSETKLPIRDGLLKLKDFPHGFGGSGIEVVE